LVCANPHAKEVVATPVATLGIQIGLGCNLPKGGHQTKQQTRMHFASGTAPIERPFVGGRTDVDRKTNMPARNETDLRTAPDPLAAILPAMSALAAIASIAAINWVGQERTADRTRTRRKAAMALRDLESCCLGLSEIFKRFQRSPKLFGATGTPATTPMKFGVFGPRVDADAVRLYQQLVNDIASMLVLASHNSFEAMSAIEDGEINAPEEVFFGFGEQQERLNKLMQNRASLKATVDAGVEIAENLTALVRELKKHRVD
jgi:hypothetical protein